MTTVFATGALVQSPAMHGRFGTVRGIRHQHRTGRGWGLIEYEVNNGPLTSWIDEHQVRSATLDDVVAHYQRLMRQMQEDHAAELAELADDTYALD